MRCRAIDSRANGIAIFRYLTKVSETIIGPKNKQAQGLKGGLSFHNGGKTHIFNKVFRFERFGYFCTMAEDLSIISGSRKAQYESLLPQMKGLVYGESDLIANLANICAALKEQFGFFWVGFYLVKGDELVLGPFQGPVACTRIKKGKGVCGSSWEQAKTLIVPDVDAFPGHIACSSLSKSEIVLPLIHDGKVWAVLDVDSEHLAHFDETDAQYLQKVIDLIKLND